LLDRPIRLGHAVSLSIRFFPGLLVRSSFPCSRRLAAGAAIALAAAIELGQMFVPTRFAGDQAFPIPVTRLDSRIDAR
jgi:hypothetical protein